MPTTIRNKKVENRGRKVKDIKGERFGHLVALEETPERFNGKVIWLCKCDCGNKVKVTSHRLLHTEISNCFDENCPYRDTSRKLLREEDFSGENQRCSSAMEDITAQVFGDLTAVKMTGIKSGKNLQWLCRCSCGREVKVYERELIRGNRTSCGSFQHRTGMAQAAKTEKKG
ncbi:MAG: hypothetical protein J6Y08_03190 [Clostridiales bacterium]|nr:hypothetical protein [Clostridiales bacterium]